MRVNEEGRWKQDGWITHRLKVVDGGYKFEVAKAAGFEVGRVECQDHASFFAIGQGAQKPTTTACWWAVQASGIGQDSVCMSSVVSSSRL